MNQTILQILQEFDLGLYRPIVPRSLDLGEALPPRAGNLVKVITGMRRSGKSYRLFQEMDALERAGIPKRRICYFNFEDNRIAPVTASVGDEMIEAFRYLNDTRADEDLYLFFDELQAMDGWGAWLRRIIDTTKATVYVSGSSSKMLSREISTEFRGRAIDFELLPYSYREFLMATGEGPAVTSCAYSSAQQTHLQVCLDRYLERGGFPAAIGLPVPQANALLQSYVQRVVARDVIDRHDITRPRTVSALARRLMGLNGKQVSIRKIENDLRSTGITAGRGYLADYTSYLMDAYLLFQVKEFSVSLSERTTSMPKVYVVDPGLALANSKAGTCERGQRLESAVYLELRRRNPAMRDGGISMLRTATHGYEIDFVVGDALAREPYELIQVTDSMANEMTAARELRALWEALEETGLDEGTLVVGDGSDTVFEQRDKRIRQIPAWKWFMG